MIEPRKWIAKAAPLGKTFGCSWEQRERLSAPFTRSQFAASVTSRFQPRRYTAQESSEVQPLENDVFHRNHLWGTEYYYRLPCAILIASGSCLKRSIEITPNNGPGARIMNA